jgi:hypothetical protein
VKRFGIAYRPLYCPGLGDDEYILEWHENENAARDRAEKIVRETCRPVSLVEDVAVVHPEPVWIRR